MGRMLLVGLLVAFLLCTGVGIAPADSGDAAPNASRSPTGLVTVGSNGTSLWPYTSKARAFDGRTLAINLVVHGDVETVRRHLRRRADRNWTGRSAPGSPEPIASDSPVADDIPWRDGHAATRYTYVETADRARSGTWLDESYQLYDGTYFGTRYHVRAYASPNPAGNWTAMQAHREYWDWFWLRHTVTGIAGAQRYVEADFVDDPVVDRVWQRHLDNGDTSDGNGWATVIEFATAVTALGAVRATGERVAAVLERVRGVASGAAGPAVREDATGGDARSRFRAGALGASVVLVVLAVRAGAIGLEGAFPGMSPKAIAAALYPVLVGGLPLCAFVLARGVETETAFGVTVVGLGAACLLDFAAVEVTVVPVALVLHRIALSLLLGLVAAGSAYWADGGPGWNVLLRFGLSGWVLALLVPLAGAV